MACWSKLHITVGGWGTASGLQCAGSQSGNSGRSRAWVCQRRKSTKSDHSPRRASSTKASGRAMQILGSGSGSSRSIPPQEVACDIKGCFSPGLETTVCQAAPAPCRTSARHETASACPNLCSCKPSLSSGRKSNMACFKDTGATPPAP